MSKGAVTAGPYSEAAVTTVKSKDLRGGALGLLSGAQASRGHRPARYTCTRRTPDDLAYRRERQQDAENTTETRLAHPPARF